MKALYGALLIGMFLSNPASAFEIALVDLMPQDRVMIERAYSAEEASCLFSVARDFIENLQEGEKAYVLFGDTSIRVYSDRRQEICG